MKFLAALVAVVAIGLPAATLASDVTSDRAQASAIDAPSTAARAPAPPAQERHEACACACTRTGDHAAAALRH